MFIVFMALTVCLSPAFVQTEVHWKVHKRTADFHENTILWMCSRIRTLVVISTLERQPPEFLKRLHDILMLRTSSCAVVTAHVALDTTCLYKKVQHGPWKNICEAEQAYILFSRTYNDLICYFNVVRENTGVGAHLRNPLANTLVFAMDPGTSTQAKSVLKSLWETHGILNIALNLGGSSKFYVYNPFHNWEKGGNLDVSEATELRTAWRRRFFHLSGYPVRVVMFHRWPTALENKKRWTGVDGLFLTTLSKAMGFSVTVVKPTQVREYVGALEALVNGEADMALNGRFLEQQDGDVSLTRPAYFDRLCAAVRRAPRLPQWKTLLRIFSPKMNVILLTIVTLVACTWSLLHRRDAFLTTLQIFLGHSLHPVPSSLSQRTLLISCIFSGIVIVAAYQGQLVTMLSRTDYLPDIDTLAELANSDLDIATGANTILNNTFTDDGPEAQQLRSHLRLLVREEGLLEYLEFSEDAGQLAALTRESRAMEYVARPGSQLHVVAECVRYYHLAYLMPQGSPLIRRVDIIISRLVEGGLFSKWSKSPEGAVEHVPSEKVFTLEDLLIAFLILAIGLLLSLLVFLVELRSKYRQHRHKVLNRRRIRSQPSWQRTIIYYQ